MKEKLKSVNASIGRRRTDTASKGLNLLLTGVFLATILLVFNTAGSMNLDNTLTSDSHIVTESAGTTYSIDGYDFTFLKQDGRILKDKYIGLTNQRKDYVYIATNMTTGQTYSTCTHELKHHKYKWIPHIRFDNPLGEGKIGLLEEWFDRPVYSDTCFKLLIQVEKQQVVSNRRIYKN